ncbi:aldehyde dehydrogenase family protein [uncultured Cohaesibacter sp.]|uniref:L-piperidine-6-carboxylate dehydrogenase n=1 Tax=uncultured Cohaesibacter sp. TaxID=1002546 RepID=UPI00292E87AF|nr:aldehyde dehydrogenase family protein [uncultured Cohaesibacter sp.]
MSSSLATETKTLLEAMGVEASRLSGTIKVSSPIDGSLIGEVAEKTPEDMNKAVELAHEAFQSWRVVPAPVRGELVRLLGEELRKHKEALGKLVSIEAGKILSEGLGEVQEMIDICDFAVGQSRQLYGKTIASERPGHRMMETWHPMGVCGVISAFNFPVAVWSWNTCLALVAGDAVVWKPSEKTPLTALACDAILEKVIASFDAAPEGLHQLIIGGPAVGEALVDNPLVPIISATGSTRMGKAVGPRVAARFGRSILELGGNNAMIVAPSADLDMAVRAICFSAVGTAGQRCTSLRRLIVHESVADTLVPQLKKAYASLPVGTPLDAGTLVGPLIDKAAFDMMQTSLAHAKAEGGTVTGGERTDVKECDGGYYVRPAIAEMPAQTEVVKTETFAPILYVMTYKDFDEALKLHNDVPQGLSSCIFTLDMREAETFMSAAGSDCGICNVNIGPSGAEIGGAFGGEKETGGGRESGSDAWKGYMRRATNTINYSAQLPLAQGVSFDV